MKHGYLAAVAFFFAGLALGAVLIWFILPAAVTVQYPQQLPPAAIAPTPSHPDVVAAMDRCQPMLNDCAAYHDCVRREAGDAVANGLPDCPAPPAPPPLQPPPEYLVCFSPPVPSDGCDPMAAVVHAIDSAKKSIWMQTYVLTSQATVDALLRAVGRQIPVTLIVDKEMLREQPQLVISLVQAGLTIRVDASVLGAARNNLLVIDGAIALAGSFDFTAAAEHGNADEVLVTDDSALVDRYRDNWNFHLAHSEPVRLAAAPAATPSPAPARHRPRPRGRPKHHVSREPGDLPDEP
jgi:phosphatidylserine/phosphatidylglycerophosphate/cardiolipin synthase-like enzyme